MWEFKKNKSSLIIMVIFFLAIGLVVFKYKINTDYIKVNKHFENALVIEDEATTDKTVNIEIIAKMIQGDGIKSCKNSTELRGTILIDTKKYELKGRRCSKSDNNNYICIVKDSNDSSNHKYKCYISADLNSILVESPNGSEFILYPSQNIEEALSLKSKLLGTNKKQE